MNRNRFLPLFLFSPDGDPTGGGAATTPVAAPVTGNPDPDDTPDGDADAEPEVVSPNATIQELRSDLERANKRVSELIGEKRKLQGQKRTLTADAVALDAYRKLGKPDEIAARLESGDKAVSERSRDAKRTSLTQSCKVAGIDAEALESLDGAMNVEYLVEGEGESQTAYVTFKNGDKDEKKELGEWVKGKWPKLESSLFSDGAAEQDTQVKNPNQQTKTVTGYVRTPPAGSGKTKTVFDRIRERNQAQGEKPKSVLELAQEAKMVR